MLRLKVSRKIYLSRFFKPINAIVSLKYLLKQTSETTLKNLFQFAFSHQKTLPSLKYLFWSVTRKTPLRIMQTLFRNVFAFVCTDCYPVVKVWFTIKVLSDNIVEYFIAVLKAYKTFFVIF